MTGPISVRLKEWRWSVKARIFSLAIRFSETIQTNLHASLEMGRASDEPTHVRL
jgi:hypothetical protein